jgi:transcription elongation factor Elf1
VEEGKEKVENKSHDKLRNRHLRKKFTCGECHLMANVFSSEKEKL